MGGNGGQAWGLRLVTARLGALGVKGDKAGGSGFWRAGGERGLGKRRGGGGVGGLADLGLLALGSDAFGLGRARLLVGSHMGCQIWQLQRHHALLVACYVLLPLLLIG